jgi:hypothetical protein
MATAIVGSSGNLIGVLNLESDRTDAYDSIALELLTLFASGVAIVATEKGPSTSGLATPGCSTRVGSQKHRTLTMSLTDVTT